MKVLLLTLGLVPHLALASMQCISDQTVIESSACDYRSKVSAARSQLERIIKKLKEEKKELSSSLNSSIGEANNNRNSLYFRAIELAYRYRSTIQAVCSSNSWNSHNGASYNRTFRIAEGLSVQCYGSHSTNLKLLMNGEIQVTLNGSSSIADRIKAKYRTIQSGLNNQNNRSQSLQAQLSEIESKLAEAIAKLEDLEAHSEDYLAEQVRVIIQGKLARTLAKINDELDSDNAFNKALRDLYYYTAKSPNFCTVSSFEKFKQLANSQMADEEFQAKVRHYIEESIKYEPSCRSANYWQIRKVFEEDAQMAASESNIPSYFAVENMEKSPHAILCGQWDQFWSNLGSEVSDFRINAAISQAKELISDQLGESEYESLRTLCRNPNVEGQYCNDSRKLFKHKVEGQCNGIVRKDDGTPETCSGYFDYVYPMLGEDNGKGFDVSPSKWSDAAGYPISNRNFKSDGVINCLYAVEGGCLCVCQVNAQDIANTAHYDTWSKVCTPKGDKDGGKGEGKKVSRFEYYDKQTGKYYDSNGNEIDGPDADELKGKDVKKTPMFGQLGGEEIRIKPTAVWNGKKWVIEPGVDVGNAIDTAIAIEENISEKLEATRDSLEEAYDMLKENIKDIRKSGANSGVGNAIDTATAIEENVSEKIEVTSSFLEKAYDFFKENLKEIYNDYLKNYIP